ncbi:hypothetical protein [Pseudomonas shirazensis]|uniref:hypothetical protein n=1 Tax=Pseudomonas shirazensis TaxID=2745494 RepID=UPI003D28A0DA
MVNATCPGNVEVRANEGGPIFINEKEATLKKSTDIFVEAKVDGMTVSLSIDPDGNRSMSFTGKGGVNGMCEIAEED